MIVDFQTMLTLFHSLRPLLLFHPLPHCCHLICCKCVLTLKLLWSTGPVLGQLRKLCSVFRCSVCQVSVGPPWLYIDLITCCIFTQIHLLSSVNYIFLCVCVWGVCSSHPTHLETLSGVTAQNNFVLICSDPSLCGDPNHASKIPPAA